MGRDAEVRVLQNGKPVINFSVATDEGYKDAQGNWVEKTEWTDVSYFTTEAGSNFLQPKLIKGALVYVEGKKETRKFTDKDGNERSAVACNARTVRPLAGFPTGGNGATQSGAGATPVGGYDDSPPF
jgi:single-strand DNA-binding protein